MRYYQHSNYICATFYQCVKLKKIQFFSLFRDTVSIMSIMCRASTFGECVVLGISSFRSQYQYVSLIPRTAATQKSSAKLADELNRSLCNSQGRKNPPWKQRKIIPLAYSVTPLIKQISYTVPFRSIRPVTCHRACGLALILVNVTRHIDFGLM